MNRLWELRLDNAAEWLVRQGFATAGAEFSELGGGVSNTVILASAPEFRIVLKQALGQLRVAEVWRADPDRILREAEAMDWVARLPGASFAPSLRARDADNRVIAMEAAPCGAEMWKALLFRGEIHEEHARRAGAMLGRIASASWNRAEARQAFGNREAFDQLRTDPYYRFTAERYPEVKGYFEELIDRSEKRAVSLTHGDWSPKNLLVWDGGMWAIDWECAHFGDPSFDAAFLLNHLVLKSIAMPRYRERFAASAHAFGEALRESLPEEGGWVLDGALEHAPALLLARVDGKSPAEYLDESGRETARRIALRLMARPVKEIGGLFGI
ncbi:MAG TPA: aminoglycoside phosphotransferase family protein [Bryobacteraceae bacterium]|nr:aminoglycoside phosphotransferase family protein [Bryobacteraceae bacterium]